MRISKKNKNEAIREDDFSIDLYLSKDGPNKGEICFINKNGIETVVSQDVAAAADAIILSTANAYTDSKVVGLLDLRGSFTPSGSYPTTGGSGTTGEVLKGDTWLITGLLYNETKFVGTQQAANKYQITALENNPAQDDTKWLVIANDDKGETHVSGLTPTADTSRTGKWYKVFEYSLGGSFDHSSFKLLMNEAGNSDGGGSVVEYDIILKRQSASTYININISQFHRLDEFLLSSFDVLWNDTTKILSFYYKPTKNFMATEWNILGSTPSINSTRISWKDSYLGVTTLAAEVNDVVSEKNIYLNRINGAYNLPSADGTAGQFLQTNGSGVLSFTTLTTGGLLGIANTSGIYTYYTTLTLAMAGAVSGDTIEQFGNITETGNVTITWKDGVNLNGNGYTYNYTNIAGNCFIDNGVTVKVKFYNWYINRVSATTSGKIWDFTNTSSEVDFYGGKSRMAVSSGTYTLSNWTVGRLYGFNGEAVNNGYGILFNNATGTIENCVGSCGASIYGVYITTCLRATNIIGINLSDSTGIELAGAGTYSHIIGRSVTGNGIKVSSVLVVASNMTGISVTSIGLSNFYGNVSNSHGRSSSGYGLFSYDGTCVNSTGYSATGISGYLQNGNDGPTTFANGCSFVSDGNYALGFQCSDNNSEIKGGTVTCNWDNAGGHGITIVTATAANNIRNIDVTVKNVGANYLYAASAKTIKFGSMTGKGATIAINANVTQGTAITPDAQGNLFI